MVMSRLNRLQAGAAQDSEPGSAFGERVETAINEISQVVLGKEAQVRLALCCLFAGGHLLLEDKPGMGKTTLSQALAAVFGLEHHRIQFTSDLLPADILGVSVYDQQQSSFTFHKGPIFSNLVLADEINRTTPKTQSALLEAMEEGQVTVDGVTRPLPSPFFVIATQNPISFAGTYPLPESQLDRFLMRLELGYPDAGVERRLLLQSDQRQRLSKVVQRLSATDIDSTNDLIPLVHISDTLLDYIQRLVAFTRQDEQFGFGLSPRGALALVRCSRTWALMNDRRHVVPEDVQAVLGAVVDHRLRSLIDSNGGSSAAFSQTLLNDVSVLGD